MITITQRREKLEERKKMRIQKIINNYKKTEVYLNVDYGKSRTDKTHFKPNVNVWNDLQGASNRVGMYDENEEMGKIRHAMMSNTLDMAEKDEIMKNEYNNAVTELDKAKMETLEKMQMETTAETTAETKTE